MKTHLISILFCTFSFVMVFPQQYISSISVDLAHWITQGSEDIIIAVFDDGIEVNHPQLNGKIDPNGWNFFDNNNNVLPYYELAAAYGARHGTGVAGIIANIAPSCKILPIKFYNPQFQMQDFDYTEILTNAFTYVRNLQASFPEKRIIINISYGFTGTANFYNAITNQINLCVSQGIPVFCSSGNKKGFPVEYPANLNSTISVTALEGDGFDEYGQYGTGPENDFAAPDYAYPVASLNGTYEYMNATSAASPMAAGVAGLLLSVKSELTAEEIRNIMQETSEKVDLENVFYNPTTGHSNELGFGRINAFSVVKYFTEIEFINDVESISMGQIMVNGQIVNSGYKEIFISGSQIQTAIVSSSYNNGAYDTKFYNWNIEDVSGLKRNPLHNFVVDPEENQLISLYKKTKPHTIRNYLEGGDGGNILFGEKDFDVINRISPYSEYAFIYNPPFVQSTYKTEANQTHNLLNTTWRFYKWENGSANRIREEQINLSSPSEWKAIYKGIQRSDNSAAHSNNNQRKSVRAVNGNLLNVYVSMGSVWMEKSSDNGQSWIFMNSNNPLVTNAVMSPSPSIDYAPWQGTHSYIAVVSFQETISNLKLDFIRTNDHHIPFTYYVGGNWYPGATVITPVVAISEDRILVISTGGKTDQNGLVYFYGTVQQSPFNINWIHSSLIITGTTAESISPTLVADKNSPNPVFHIAWQQGSGIKYRRLTEINGNIEFTAIETPSSSSPYPNNYSPSISLTNGSPIISWTADNGSGIEKIQADNKEQSRIEKRAVVRKGPVWGAYQVMGNNVSFTNNNSVSSAQEKTVIVWSEGTANPQSKWVKRTGTYYSIPDNLSHSGIQTQVINGSDYQQMTSVVFNNNQTPYYFITTTTDFSAGIGGELEKPVIASDSSVTFGRAGIVNINGVSFVFNTGDVMVDNSVIKFLEKPDTIQYLSYTDLNEHTRTENFQLNSGSQFYFSNLYYVLNKELADTSLGETQNVNFKVELVNASTNQSAGTFDNITYDKYNLEKYANISYQVNCSGIQPGEYYLRLVTSVNTEAEYSLANLMNNSEEFQKKLFTEINYTGSQKPDNYDLAQNYPNPFNPTTTIRYQIPNDGLVTLKVYDILGSEVATLVNEQKAAGRYEVNFDASRFASGVYIYKITAGDPSTGSGQGYVSSKKMLLVK